MNCAPWTEPQAREFVFNCTSAPSFVMDGGVLLSGVEFLASEAAAKHGRAMKIEGAA